MSRRGADSRGTGRGTAWRTAARAVLHALLGNSNVTLLDQPYRVTPIARGVRGDRDYPLLAALAEGRRTIWDVGANLGLTSLVMARNMAADGRLVAFEASELACRTVLRHVELNRLAERVRVVNAVIGERSGQPLDFFWDHAAGGASTLPGYLDHHDAMVKTSLALDDYLDAIQEAAEPPPELLKIDIEGAEAAALRGARRLLEQHRPDVVVELHGWPGTSLEENAAGILDWLPGVDYSMVYLRSRRVVEDASALAGRGRCHVLLLPKGRELPSALDGVDTSVL